MRKYCICTIICSNYIAYARTLFQSLKKRKRNYDFFVFLVDREESLEDKNEGFKILYPSNIFKQDDYKKYAFLYNALELSTNVKPSVLRTLLNRGYSKVIYLDPDIYFYGNVNNIFKKIARASILLTPHTIEPYSDESRPNDQDLLLSGAYNLGFIGLNKCSDTEKFLIWWEKRCLALGYSEPRNGLMVDQRWIDLVPCYFRKVKILRDVSVNVAYWNLHERKLSRVKNKWMVNGEKPLLFFHFSGIRYDQDMQVSKYQNRYNLTVIDELKPLFNEYRKCLIKNGIASTISQPYPYNYFDNGIEISDLARKAYSWFSIDVAKDPFQSNSFFYKWLMQRKMLGMSKGAEAYNSMNYNPSDTRLRIINFILRMVLQIIGVKYYQMLMKYINYVSILRNQKFIFIKDYVKEQRTSFSE